jgi:hypothetical protein
MSSPPRDTRDRTAPARGRRLGLAGIGLALIAPCLPAQRITPPPRPAARFSREQAWALGSRPRLRLPASARPARGRTHAVAGAVLGGVVFGFLGAVTGLGLCHFDDPCRHPTPFVVGGFVLGGAAGAGIGARLGAALFRR